MRQSNQKETLTPSRLRGRVVDVSKTLFYYEMENYVNYAIILAASVGQRMRNGR